MRFSRGKIWFVDIGPCKRFDIFQLCIQQYVKCTVFFVALLGPQIKDASSPDCLLPRLEIFAILKIGVDLTKVGNKLGEGADFHLD